MDVVCKDMPGSRQPLSLTKVSWDTQAKGEGVGHPRIAHETPRLRVWHKLEAASFQMPSAAAYLAFACPEVPTTCPQASSC